MQLGSPKNSWYSTAMFLLILGILAMFATIAYTITLQDFTYNEINNVTGLLITVTGILLGLSGLSPLSKSLDRMKLQVTLAITTLLWLLAVAIESQTTGFYLVTSSQRYFFLTGVALFALLVVVYSLSTIEATRQRLVAEQAARASQPGPTAK